MTASGRGVPVPGQLFPDTSAHGDLAIAAQEQFSWLLGKVPTLACQPGSVEPRTDRIARIPIGRLCRDRCVHRDFVFRLAPSEVCICIALIHPMLTRRTSAVSELVHQRSVFSFAPR